MAKIRLDSPAGTPLDPFAFEKQFVKPQTNPSFASGVTDQLQFVAPDQIEPGYGTLGNSGYAAQVIQETKAQNQGTLELAAKGIANVAKTIGIEVAKTPGYAVGLIGAAGNELVGDGKNSMAMVVDNAWINGLEGLDKDIQSMIPVYISKQVQEGNLLDKLGSGAWWATTGANGIGFMAAMFAPGAVLKALKIGEGIAAAGETLANISTKLGKAATGESWVAKLGLMDAPAARVARAVEKKTIELIEKSGYQGLDDAARAEIAATESAAKEAAGIGFKYTKDFARNANGIASATINTALESSAEAANTFDNVKQKYLAQGLSDEEAGQKAGEAASAVFKGNLALLAISNVLDEMWIWKTIGSAGEKEAAQSVLSKIFKDGAIDMEVVKQLPKELTRASVLKRGLSNFGKNFAKEGFYEEGTQTILQQNIEGGKDKHSILGNLSDIATSYLKDFSDNGELHESIFLGGLLGGGASVFGTVQENSALKKSLYGGEARTKDDSIWAKYGILPETKKQKGLVEILQDNHIKQFRSYKDFMEDDGQGGKVLNEQKLADAQLEQVDNLRTNILYDLAVSQGDKLGQEIFGQYLAANYAQGFLGQEGGKELFDEHVDNQVKLAWEKRFEETYGREATSKESSKYVDDFKKSGERIFKAHDSAESTNYPERYYHEKSKEYQDFRQSYFHEKFQTLLTLDSIEHRRDEIHKGLSEAGILETDLEDLNQIKNPVKRQQAIDIKNQLDYINEIEPKLSEQYKQFFTKKGVKEMFDRFKEKKELFETIKNDIQKENEELKQQVDNIPAENEAIANDINNQAAASGYTQDNPAPVVDKNGDPIDINNPDPSKGSLANQKPEIDDVSDADYNEFKTSGKAPLSVLNRIADKLGQGKPLTNREKEIVEKQGEDIKDIYNQKKAILDTQSKQPEVNKQIEDQDANKVDEQVDSVYKKKGVNLYPSTGRNLLNEFVEIEPGKFAEKLNPKPSQQLWFKVLDEEVSKNPTSYTVKVTRLDDKSNPELQTQLRNDSDPSNRNDGDLYTVLYKDGQPVIKESSRFIKTKNRFLKSKIQSPTFGSFTGKKIQDLIGSKLKEGDLVKTDWWNPSREVERYEAIFQVKNGKLIELDNPSFNPEKDKRTFSDLFLLEDVESPETIKEGNYVFTSLWRPENLYPIKDGKPKEFILAEQSVVDNFLISVGLPTGLDLGNLSDKQKDLLTKSGVKDLTEEGIKTAAFFHGKAEYSLWYRILQDNPAQLQVAGVTNGHSVKTYSDKKGTPTWNKPLNGIKGLTLVKSNKPSSSDLKGGKFELSTTGVIKVGVDEFAIPNGDLVIVDDQNNVHPMKARNLNEEEVNTVLYLLSLRSQKGPTEAIKLAPPGPVQFGNKSLKEVPVFYNEEKKMSRANLIETLISFGSKNGGKGEIYFNKETVNTNPILVWTNFNGETHNIEVRLIKDSLEKNDLTPLKELVSFLQQKRFNINEHLLGTTQTNGNPIFSKPSVVYKRDSSGNRVPELEWDQTRSYYDHLLNDVLTTTTNQIPGYPNRVQRNLWFNKQAIPEEVYTDLTWGEEPSNIDKIKEIRSLYVGQSSYFNIEASGLEVSEAIGITLNSPDISFIRNEFSGKLLDWFERGIKYQEDQSSKTKSRRRQVKSLDDFKEADKILTTSDMLKAKIKSGEIQQKCK